MARQHNRERRLAWFVAGRAALYNTVRFEDGDSDPRCQMYACPECGLMLPVEALDTGELTDEHVPPQALDGKRLVLTCRSCNNRVGTRLDAEAVKERDTAALLRGDGGPHPISFGPGLPGTLRTTPDVYWLSINRALCNPVRFDEFTSSLGLTHRRHQSGWAPSTDPLTFGFTVPVRHDDRRAALSFVRAAYLTAFAAFGYRLIYSPAYRTLRRQLRDHDAEVLRPLPVGVTPTNRWGIYGCFDSTLGFSHVFQFGNRWVALPASGADEGWWQRMTTVAVPGTPVTFQARVHRAFPTKPVHTLDFMPVKDGGWVPLDFYGELDAA